MQETSLETVCFVVVKARAIAANEGVVEAEPASNPSDDDQHQALAGHRDDATRSELHRFIETLNEDQKSELVALLRLGRGDADTRDWQGEIDRARRERTVPCADYLLDTPLLADLLEEGLERFGLRCAETERAHL